jgi:amino acid adenylation domain-containing protein
MLTEAIATQAQQNPQRIAVAMGADVLTNAELDRRASQLAQYLHSLGAGPEGVAAVCLERSPQFVIAALAVMKCGAAYLPMDSAHPAERLRFIVQDAGALLVLTQEKFAGHFTNSGARVVTLDGEKDVIAQQPTQFAAIGSDPDQLAYVIYTSGSTGQPKGVEITHRNLSNLIAWHLRAFELDSSDRATFQAGVGFDAAVWEIWPALTVGAALYLPDEITRLSPEAMRDWLVANKITITFIPTAIAEQLLALTWPPETALRFLLTGAETLHRYPPTGLPFALVNNYGPTECTVVATSAVISAGHNRDGLPSIGRPVDNVEIYLADEQLREVPDGIAGEIYIGGAGVARGYRNRPALNAEQFISNPFRPSAGRVYRTGDFGRRLSNGEIAFLGRADDQIKIRGQRIELDEINSVLKDHPFIQASIVIAREDAPGAKRLVAYVVPIAGAERNEKALREAVRRRLPDYMEPSAFVWMESLPLTANGKIDRAALPPPGAENNAREGEFVAPRTPLEETLARIISEVLKLPRVGVHDDFFNLGGHSLLGAQVVARVRDQFGVELRLLDVFDAPTVAELSLKIEEALTRQLASMSEAEVEATLATVGNG